MKAWAISALLALCGSSGAAPTPQIDGTVFSFTLPRNVTTSAGVYDAAGRLVRTLWRGEALTAGAHTARWDGRNDAGLAAEFSTHEIRVLYHSVAYRWQGVIGNSSRDNDPSRVRKAYLPPTSLAVIGNQVYYAVGYNEQQTSVHGFLADDPQRDNRPANLIDTFIGISMVAADATRLYWANTGGMSRTSFVGAFDALHAKPLALDKGQSICLSHRAGVPGCFGDEEHHGVIDVESAETAAPGGLAVQRHGRILAVAHAASHEVRLFDKITGAPRGRIDVPLRAGRLNLLAMAPDDDLWVISGRRVLRFTDLDGAPKLAAELPGLDSPLAVAIDPRDANTVWVADGGQRQQIRRFDRWGVPGVVLGTEGGYLTAPEVRDTKLCFMLKPEHEQTGLVVLNDGSLWVVDTCNNRMLHFGADGHSDTQIAYLPAVYASTVDHGNPGRVFANYLEFEVNADETLPPGRSWRLVRNWLGGLPEELRDADSFNGQFGGFRTVETLSNGHTYGVLAARGRQFMVELPASGPLRVIQRWAAPLPGSTVKVMYENGDLGYAVTGAKSQTVMRQAFTGFDSAGDPTWATQAETMASAPVRPGAPYYRGAFSGVIGPRFPLTGAGDVVFFDQAVVGNEGFHLGAVALHATDWRWQASPSGPLDGRGTFQTKAVDGSINYGGNVVWTAGHHVLYGYHGEFFKDMGNQVVGQANQFMDFHDDGLFIGQFGVPSTRPAAPGMSGNAFSPTLVQVDDRLYLYHNDESTQGGIHRWRIDGWRDLHELRGSALPGQAIILR